MDICYETVSEQGLSPPAHFLDQTFIKSLTDILSEGGVCTINTIIKSEVKKAEIFKEIGLVQQTQKFKSKCTEDVNEVVYLVKTEDGSATTTSKDRLATINKNVAAMGVRQDIWLSKKQMKIVHHADKMTPLV